MDIKNNQNIDALVKKVDEIKLIDSISIAKAIALYIKINNNLGVVNNVSLAYIDNYDGKSFHKKFAKYFDVAFNVLNNQSLDESDRRNILKKSAERMHSLPTKVSEMKKLQFIIVEEVNSWLKWKSAKELRENLVSKFRFAIKKYLNLTFTLGYNEPSLCAKELAQKHKIDKFILSGDFPLILLPFLPDIEDEIKTNYEHYEMTDAWQMLKAKYYDKKQDFSLLAIEIKRAFTQNIPNFSNYIDNLYTNTYYNLRLGKKR